MTDLDTEPPALNTSKAKDAPAKAPAPPKAKRRTPERTPWSPADYYGTASGSGASKLASSGVAPLVAAARGYSTLTVENHGDFAEANGIGDRRSKQGRQFRGLFLDGGDALVMPWFSLDKMRPTLDDIEAQRHTTVQYRPSNPRLNQQGKPVKYELLAGGGTYLDVHPAIPGRWFATTPRTLIAEGLLKGDSALTAQLRVWYADEQLAVTASDAGDRNVALKRLAALLDGIPQSERTAIVSIAGVGNWRHNPEWFGVKVEDKDVLIAFDGDVESNWNVWSMAADMYNFLVETKKSNPALVVMSSNPTAASALLDDPHMGLDDFFRSHGGWADLESMIQIDLPERPERPNVANIGDWRISPDGLSSQEYVETPTEGTQKGIGHWVTRIALGGRIVSHEILRPATDEEVEGKPFGTGLTEANHDVHVTVEVAWEDGVTRQPTTANITGPIAIMNYPPNEWIRMGAHIPQEVLVLPQWPPAKGREWLRALKAHRNDEAERHTVWSTMGWVPVEDHASQAFIVGNQVIAGNEKAKNATMPGVLGSALTNAESFGVHDVYTGPGLTDPKGKYNLADDLRELLDLYWENTPWLDPKIAVTTLAIALRPAVPLPTSVAAYFVGAPQKGKSWTARQIMSFWQKRPGVWERTLPGSASDTFATTESAVSKAPIWVVDDVAPMTDRRASEMQESKIGDLIRAVHNKLGKRRMNRDMTERDVPTPMALTIFTAENESPTQSIRERVVSVQFTGLNGKNMQRADLAAYKSTVASRVTAAVIRMYIEMGERVGWEDVVATARGDREVAIDSARDILGELGIAPGDRSRPAEIAADLSMGLAALQTLMVKAGMRKEARQIGWAKREQWMYLLTEQIGLGHQNKADVSPGRVLLDCVRNLLSSGMAHISNLDNPSAPPLEGPNSSTANMFYGWAADSQGDMRPRGTTIGHLARISDPGSSAEPDEVIFIAADDAFQLAQRHYPKKVQYGASTSTSWRNVWELGLIHPRFVEKPTNELTRQFRFKGTKTKGRGVPLSAEVLFSGSSDEELGV
ncbi:MAG: hypothetical protein KJ659_09920 [Actinobacteria bacterium]|nr:hypothetical protein [Actinomycetota bacterium]MBU1609812.1 hypothetical protein [Actinomycetota bacterium]MBU2316317.1 hypothetical protein [Actinomycetota bacterium]MBU2385793.1 hypothetical protein [Actinomycetota bacterium]